MNKVRKGSEHQGADDIAQHQQNITAITQSAVSRSTIQKASKKDSLPTDTVALSALDPDNAPGTGRFPYLEATWPSAEVHQQIERALDPESKSYQRVAIITPEGWSIPVRVEEVRVAADDGTFPLKLRRESAAQHFLVKIKPGAVVEQLAAAIDQNGYALEEQIDDHGLYQIELPELTVDAVPEAVARFERLEFVAYAEADGVRHRAVAPNDPRYNRAILGTVFQWGLNHTENILATAQGVAEKPDTHISAEAAWDIRTDASTVIVAVIDDGVRRTHEDLAANMWRNPGETAGDGIDNDGNGLVDDIFGYDFGSDDSEPLADLPTATQDNGHGTHVAGIIGAVGNNEVGVTGVAWKTQIMALKMWPNAFDSRFVRAIDYSIAKGAHISNNSYGSKDFGSPSGQAFKDAVKRTADAGRLFVVASGNDGRDTDSVADAHSDVDSNPADGIDNVITVANLRWDGNLSFSSNFGATTVDIAAPGTEILSCGNKSDTDYVEESGTSMAAPMVAGSLALLKAQFPAENYRTLMSRLYAGAIRTPELAGKMVTGGRLNLRNSITLANTAIPPILNPLTGGGTFAAGTNRTLTANADGFRTPHFPMDERRSTGESGAGEFPRSDKPPTRRFRGLSSDGYQPCRNYQHRDSYPRDRRRRPRYRCRQHCDQHRD